MRALEELRQHREDISPDVVHLTRRDSFLDERSGEPVQVSAMQVLQKIVSEGFIIPTFALRVYGSSTEPRPVIKGKHPAVCFTEQPLRSLPTTLRILHWKYEPYGVILDKRYVDQLGGRPVIYGDDETLNALPQDLKYLWSFFNPILGDPDNPAPVDWTHEREWRFRVPDEEDPMPGFPLNFTYASCPQYKPFRILVHSRDDAAQMDGLLQRLRANPPLVAQKSGPVQRKYEKGIAAARVICLESLSPFC